MVVPQINLIGRLLPLEMKRPFARKQARSAPGERLPVPAGWRF
jgi:hypothetical protein